MTGKSNVSCPTMVTAPRIVTIARSAEKITVLKDKFRNIPEEKLLIVEGNVGE